MGKRRLQLCLVWLARKDITEKVTSAQKPKRGKRASCIRICWKNSPGRGKSTPKCSVMYVLVGMNSKEVIMAGVEQVLLKAGRDDVNVSWATWGLVGHCKIFVF